MNRAAPRICVWFVISLSCPLLSNRSDEPPSSSETLSCRLVTAIPCSLVFAPGTVCPGRVIRSNPCLHGSASIPTGGAVPDRQGLGGGGVNLGTGALRSGGVAFGSGGEGADC